MAHQLLSANLLPGICYLVSNANIYDLCQGLVPKKKSSLYVRTSSKYCNISIVNCYLLSANLLPGIYYLVSNVNIYDLCQGLVRQKIEFVCPQVSWLISYYLVRFLMYFIKNFWRNGSATLVALLVSLNSEYFPRGHTQYEFGLLAIFKKPLLLKIL